MTRWRQVVTALAVATGLASPADANPADLFGFGARGQAMAGAHVAAVDDASANYYNPARLAGADDIRLDLGYQLALPRLTIDSHDNGVDASRGLAVGLTVPGRVSGVRLAIGAAVFLPDQHLTRTRTLAAGQPRWQLYDNRPQRLLFAANLALTLPYGIAIGGGLAYMSSTEGTVMLAGTVGFPDPDASQLDLAIDVDLRTIRYPQAGVAWQLRPWLTVAASYRGGFTLILDQTFDIVGDIGTPGFEPLVADGSLHLRSRAQDLFQPAQVTAGLLAQVTPRLALAFDLGWHRWSRFEHPAARIELAVDVGDFNDLVDIPPQAELPAPHFHDVAVPRLGVEYVAVASLEQVWRGRGGYAYEPTPTPMQRGAPNFVDGDKHTFSVGAGIELPGLAGVVVRPVGFDVALAVTRLPARTHAKLVAADPVGDYIAAGWVLSAGVSSRWRF